MYQNFIHRHYSRVTAPLEHYDTTAKHSSNSVAQRQDSQEFLFLLDLKLLNPDCISAQLHSQYSVSFWQFVAVHYRPFLLSHTLLYTTVYHVIVDKKLLKSGSF